MTIQYNFKILLLGPGAVGKTSLLYRFVKNQFADYKATIGVDFMIKEVKLGINMVKLNIWDIGGHKRFKSLHQSYYKNTQGALLVFDLTRKETYDQLEEWHLEMKEILKKDIPFVLIGNKVDLIKKRKHRKVKIEEAKKYAELQGSLYIETSAKTGENVSKAFTELSLRMISKYDDVIRVD